MSLRRLALGAALVLAGLAAAVGIGLLANTISGDSVGLSAQPLSAGDTLAPPASERRREAREARAERRREQRADRRRAARRRAARERTAASQPPATTPRATEVPDDDRGGGELEPGDDSSGRGRSDGSGGGFEDNSGSGSSGSDDSGGDDSGGDDSSGSGSGDFDDD
jgi:hypothetical protein